MKVLVVIPAYNEEGSIGKVIKGAENSEIVDYIIVVDDGSTDKTYQKAVKSKPTRIIRHEKNQGLAESVRDGFHEGLKFNPNIFVIMSGDDQMNPKSLKEIISPIKEKKADIVIGSRFLGDVSQMPIHRVFTNRMITYIFNKITDEKLTDAQSGYRAFSNDIVKELKLSTTGYLLEVHTLFEALDLGARVMEVPINAIYESHRSDLKSVNYSIKCSKLLVSALKNKNRKGRFID